MSTENDTPTSNVPPSSPSPSSPVSASMYDTGSAAAYGPSPADVEKNKVMAILAYILFFVPLLAAKDSPFAMYHANQGLILFLFSVAVNIIGWAIPVIGWLVVLPVGSIAALVFMIMGIINAANGEMKPLPLIGGITLLK